MCDAYNVARTMGDYFIISFDLDRKLLDVRDGRLVQFEVQKGIK